MTNNTRQAMDINRHGYKIKHTSYIAVQEEECGFIVKNIQCVSYHRGHYAAIVASVLKEPYMKYLVCRCLAGKAHSKPAEVSYESELKLFITQK